MKTKILQCRRAIPLSVICSIAVLLSSCGFDEDVRRIDNPTSPASLTNLFDVQLPKTAKNMYMVIHAGGLQEFHRYVRLEVAPEDIESAIGAIAKWDSPRNNDISFYERRDLAPSCFVKPVRAAAPIVWWRPDAIERGYALVQKEGGRRYFWVDLDKSIIFFFETD